MSQNSADSFLAEFGDPNHDPFRAPARSIMSPHQQYQANVAMMEMSLKAFQESRCLKAEVAKAVMSHLTTGRMASDPTGGVQVAHEAASQQADSSSAAEAGTSSSSAWQTQGWDWQEGWSADGGYAQKAAHEEPEAAQATDETSSAQGWHWSAQTQSWSWYEDGWSGWSAKGWSADGCSGEEAAQEPDQKTTENAQSAVEAEPKKKARIPRARGGLKLCFLSYKIYSWVLRRLLF